MATKIKEIPLSGLSTSPSDLQADDGNLTVAGNILHHDGTILRAQSPQVFITSSPYTGTESDGRYSIRAIYQHANETYHHIIYNFIRVYRGQQINTYGWADSQTPDHIIEFSNGRTPIVGDSAIQTVTSVGNTLILYSADGPFYFLFKNGSYTFIGNKIPDLEISFSLVPKPYHFLKDNISQKGDASDDGKTEITYPSELMGDADTYDQNYGIYYKRLSRSEDVEALTNASLAIANSFTGSWCDKNGLFSQPFLARAAYRMFDGSNIMATSPVLLRPTTFVNPVVTFDHFDLNSGETWLGCMGLGCKLCYHISNADSLTDWSDIVNGVDIFVSNQFYTFKQDSTVNGGVVPSLGYSDADTVFSKSVPRLLWSHMSVCKYADDEGDKAKSQWDATRNAWNYSSDFPLSTSDVGTVGSGEDNKVIYDADGNVVAGFYKSKDSHHHHFFNKNRFTDSGLDDKNPVESIYPTAFVLIPKTSEVTMRDQIRDCSNFYLIKSYKFGDLDFSGNRTEINLDEGVINSITTRERLQEDYRSHDTIVPASTFAYNNRLNVTNIKRYPYEGYSPFSMFQRICGNQAHSTLSTVVYLRNTTGNIVVRREDIASNNFQGILTTDYRGIINYIYYPDSTAYKMDIILEQHGMTNVMIATVDLTIHNGLNGSVYFEGLESTIEFKTSEYADAEAYFNSLSERANGTYTIESNTIYTSDVDNPFVFRAANVEQVGNGQVIAMAPAVHALSTGQFGEFPMYCFTTEGVWALNVSDTGGWRSKQPISRDVALSADSILQTDQSVIFATSRGLMQITGSTVTYISDIFDGPLDRFIARYTPHISELFQQQPELITGLPPFKEFLQGCNMHYAYGNQRIYIGNKDYKHAYVFGMKDRLWTTVPLQITSAINSYPDALAMISDTEGTISLVNLSADGDVNTIPGYILTRPIHFDDPHGLKTIRTVVARGNFDASHISMCLYATRDLNQWLIIGKAAGPRISLRHGAPYRAFRLAILTDIAHEEYITTLSIEYETKLNNKLR